jgi:hypothetical protein
MDSRFRGNDAVLVAGEHTSPLSKRLGAIPTTSLVTPAAGRNDTVAFAGLTH